MKQSIRQSLQEVAGSEPIADIIGPKKAEVVNRTQAGIAKRLSPYGIVVKQFTINELRPPQSVIEAINQGNVFRYLTKPWDPDELQTVVSAVLRASRSVQRRHAASALAADGSTAAPVA